MWFNIDSRSQVPIYQQLTEGVKKAVAKGVLQPGEKLPSVRELSVRITVNPNTIAKAYQELEREGIIETLRGRGTFVASRDTVKNEETKRQIVKEMLDKILVEAFYMGMEERELLALIKEEVYRWYGQKGGTTDDRLGN